MDLTEWVILSLDPDLASELSKEWAEESRYSSIEAFVENLPAKLKPDRQGRRRIKMPLSLIASVKSLTQLHSLPGLKSFGKAVTYMTHYGLVKMLKEIDLKRLYRLNRALAIATPAIKEFYGVSALDLLFSPVVHYKEPSRTVSVIPMYYDTENTVMTNIDTIMAVFGQLLPVDMAVTWAVSIALKESHVAMNYGLHVTGAEIAEKMKKQAQKSLDEKACILKVMAQNTDFSMSLDEKFHDYLRWL